MPDRVEAIAANPFAELDLGTMFRRVELGDVELVSSQFPSAGVIVVRGDGPSDVAAAVAATRSAGRERGESHLAWWISPEHDHLAAALEEQGLAHEDAPGFEAVESALALRTAPGGDPADGVTVRRVATLDDFSAGNDVIASAFGLPQIAGDRTRALFEEFSGAGNPARAYVAFLDGQPVGAAFAVVGDAAINLFGGAVLPEARGRGVYRALVQARWDDAVKRGTPALTVQAGRMSRPILEKSGFAPVVDVRLFVDTL